LHVDGKKFRAHRSILAANSDFFLNLFRAAEDQTNFVLAGVPVRGFAVLLEFCYTNSFTLEPSNVSEVYRAASVLNFSHIASACEKGLIQYLLHVTLFKPYNLYDIKNCKNWSNKIRILITINQQYS